MGQWIYLFNRISSSKCSPKKDLKCLYLIFTFETQILRQTEITNSLACVFMSSVISFLGRARPWGSVHDRSCPCRHLLPTRTVRPCRRIHPRRQRAWVLPEKDQGQEGKQVNSVFVVKILRKCQIYTLEKLKLRTWNAPKLLDFISRTRIRLRYAYA